MRVRVEPTKCEGYGICAEHAPAVFELDEWGFASVALEGDVPPHLVEPVERAIIGCPMQAIVQAEAS